MGIDRVLFSTDYPYEESKLHVDWIDSAPLSDDERAKICYENATRILKLQSVTKRLGGGAFTVTQRPGAWSTRGEPACSA